MTRLWEVIDYEDSEQPYYDLMTIRGTYGFSYWFVVLTTMRGCLGSRLREVEQTKTEQLYFEL